MKYILILGLAISFATSCTTYSPMASRGQYETNSDTLITQSLFNDRSSSITEDNIQRILNSDFKLPEKLRVAIIKLDNPQTRSYRWSYWGDEEYLKTQQSYLDSFTYHFTRSPRVSKVSIVPELLVSKTPTITGLRETAVRLQADIVVVYSIASDLYSKYKFFQRPDIKAFATTQLLILDVRTGLVPFSTIVTKDHLSQRKKELDNSEAARAIQNQAVLLTIGEIGHQVTNFLQDPEGAGRTVSARR